MIIRNAVSRAVFNPDKMGKATLASAERLYAGLNCFSPGQEHKAHFHADQDKLYYVIEGTGEAMTGDETSAVAAGDIVLAPAGVVHSMRNTGEAPLIVLIVFSPPPQGSR